ncbi:MAG: putative Ig domain-containing protein [Acidobacteriota bacterium]
MKSIARMATALVVSLGLTGAHWAAPPGRKTEDIGKPQKILVRFKSGVELESARGITSGVGARILKSFEIVDNLHVLEVPAGARTESVLAELRKSADVLYAEPDRARVAYAVPNDPRFNELWGITKIQAPEAWDTIQGSDQVVVAVIDTGIDYDHEDLAANMWTNPGEVPGDGIDNDGNGYVDDIHGIDPVDNDSDPMDTSQCEHGTHVSGTIGAVGNNGIGVVGVNWVVRLMALRAGHYSSADQNCVLEDSDVIECFQYVAAMKDRGVNLVAVNASFGGIGYSQSYYDAIEQSLTRKGILLVAAAGNDIPGWPDVMDNDIQPSYPASYYLPNVISVMATTSGDARPSWSYVGAHSVHVGGCGGSETLSTVPGNGYEKRHWIGTSMAAPHVAGLVALLKAQDSSRDWKALKALVMSGGDRVSGTQSNSISGNRINANGSVNCSGRTVLNRLLPRTDLFLGTQEATRLSAVSVICDQPNPGAGMAVTTPEGQVHLADNGNAGDMAAADGIFTGSYAAPRFPGTYALGFPGNDPVMLYALDGYDYSVVPYQYESTSGGTAYLAGADEASRTLTTPFPIVFGGVRFTQLTVTPNGVIVLGQYRLVDAYPLPIPPPVDEDVDGWDAVIAPFWDDLEFARTNSAVYAATAGAAPSRKYIIEWRNVHPWTPANECTSETLTFQVVFTEGSNDVLFNYQDASVAGACADHDRGGLASVGILVGRHTGTQFSYQSPDLSDGMSILWRGNCAAVSVSPEELPAATAGQAYSQVITAQGGTPPYTFSLAAGSLPPGMTLSARSGALAGTPANSGQYEFTVSAQDATGCSGWRDYTLSVGCTPIAVLPQLLPAPSLGRAYSQQITAQGGTPPYAFSLTAGSLPAGITLNTQSGELSGTPRNPGASHFTVSVQDAMSCSGHRDYVLAVSEGCSTTVSPPVLPPGTVGVAYEQTIVGSGNTPPYYYLVPPETPLPPGLNLDPMSGALAGVPTAEGSYTFCVQVMDGRFCSVYQPYILEIGQPCVALSLMPETLPAGAVGLAYSQIVSAVNGTAPYTYAVTSGALPDALALSPGTGEIYGTPTAEGTFSFTVTATDSLSCAGSRQYTIEVASCPTIVVNPQTLPDGAVGIEYSQTIAASGGTPPYAYLVSGGGLPPGLALDAVGGTIAGRPAAEGTYSFTVAVYDNRICSATHDYAIKIDPPPCPQIVVGPTTLPAGTVGTVYSQTISAGGGTAPYVYAITGGALPPGLELDQTTGVESGTPTIEGHFTAEITATDAALCTGEHAYAIDINTAPCPAIIVGPLTLAPAILNQGYAQAISAEGGTAPYHHAVTAGALPSWLTLDADSGLLSGTPTALGSSAFTITATDSKSCSGSQTYTLDVRCPALGVLPDALPAGTVGLLYDQQLTVNGGAGPYVFAVSASAVPPGLSFSPAGRIWGSPATVGRFTFIVTATDRDSCTGTKTYSLDVNDVPCPPIAVLPGILSDGKAGVPYNHQLSASGGTAPYAFALSSGAMPAGLVLDPNGALTGTPTTAGVFAFVITATDAAGCRGSQAYTVTIATGVAMPDLTTLAGARARLSADGKDVSVRFKGINQGNARAGRFAVSVYLSRGPTLGSKSKLVYTKTVSRLGAGGSTKVMRCGYTGGSSLAGMYIIIRFDPTNSVAESDESNNTLSLQLSH